MKVSIYDSELNRIISRHKWLADIMLRENHIKNGKRYCLESEMSQYVHFAPTQAKVVKESEPTEETSAKRGRPKTNQ